MANENTVNLFHNELVLHNNKLIFGSHLIHDFNQKISNCSSVDADQQSKLFLTLVKMIYESSLPLARKAEAVIMLTELFHVLSARNTSTDIMLLGESSFTGVFEYVLSRFHQDNRFYEVCHEKTLKLENIKQLSYISISSDYDLASLPADLREEHRFGIIMIDYDAVQSNFLSVLEVCSKLVRREGKLLCYGTGIFDPEAIELPPYYDGNLYQLEEECFLLELDIDTPTFTKSEEAQRAIILPVILENRKKLSDAIDKLETILHGFNIATWNTRIDEIILVSFDLEQRINENAPLFINKDLKYLINEVKNALLDLKYEALLNHQDISFFYAMVSDKVRTFCAAEL